MRAAGLLSLLGAVALLTGCYGSTEPATQVGPDSARLNGQGTANTGPAYSYFEYQAAFPPSPIQRTIQREWPAGASGPLSEPITGLRDATTYIYQLCGGDQGESAVCAQRRFFTTPGPAGKDSVKGSWRYALRGVSQPGGQVDAVASPSGSSPTGSLSHYRTEEENGTFSPITFTGFVTCVAVNGSRATVGAVGDEYFGRTDSTRRATSLFTIDDVEPGTGPVPDRLRATTAPGTTPPNCTEGPATLDQPEFSSVVVTDN